MKKWEDVPFGTEQLLKNYLEIFLIRLLQQNKFSSVIAESNIEPTGDMVEILKYIEEHYRENITLSKLCYLFHINKTTFCKQFRDQTGITVGDYIKGLIVRDAKKQIRVGSRSISQIAADLGFSSQHYFSYFFKQETGLSPTAYYSTLKIRLDSSADAESRQ